jgi:hypothetical protein
VLNNFKAWHARNDPDVSKYFVQYMVPCHHEIEVDAKLGTYKKKEKKDLLWTLKWPVSGGYFRSPPN